MGVLSRYILLLGTLLRVVSAAHVTQNLWSLYYTIKQTGYCRNTLKGGFATIEGQGPDYAYCGDHLKSEGIVYIQGVNGNLAALGPSCAGDTYRYNDDFDSYCDSPLDNPVNPTIFQPILQSYNVGVSDFNPYVTSFVTFGNVESKNPNFISFDPRKYGIEPMSIIAVVCNNRMFYGIWGNMNKDDGPPLVGEASGSIAKLCFGSYFDNYYSNNHTDILYIAFTGKDAVVGPQGAKWNATTIREFQDSIEAQGNRLIEQRIKCWSPVYCQLSKVPTH